ncbi:putative endo-1,4-beta-xylanase [Lupinus albus]|uniref:Putative endo-1,4-beta-xylanase n=1 Tax=Lupinus albus TaxID=3870 RepID=A0A6A4R2H6_LUPAL|nr:putative endo-1,4-beta-xylanase [Lupinus albus]
MCFEVKAVPYDYSAISECLQQPLKPQYNGGLIKNPELNNGLEGWTVYGNAKIEHRESSGNKYVVAYNRNQSSDTVSQKINLQKGMHYTLSGWLQVTGSNVLVKATLKTNKGYTLAGATYAESNCWSMIKGGFTADTSGPAELYFESKDTSVDIWVDNLSLQPFTEEEWKSHHVESIEKARKRKVLLKVAYKQGSPVGNATISIKQKRSGFPFGSAINSNILQNTAYQNWFTSRFTVTTFANEMKWYSTESVQGKENYAVADSMLQFAQKHNIAVRGHCVFWDDPKYQPSWVPSLSSDQLNSAVQKRIQSVVTRYKDKLIGWDVVNENLHFSFFESKLGQQFSSKVFSVVHKIDPRVTLFLNEYNTIEDQRDGSVNAANYIKKLREIQSYPTAKGVKIGIGLESHFSFAPNLPYMRSSIDMLASTGSPIWITEIDVANQPKQAEYFEQVLREAHSHPKVQGIVMWTAWSPNGDCYKICLVDKNFKNLPGGNVVDKLLREWGSKKVSGITNHNGTHEVTLFHGDYEVTITDPANKDYHFTQKVQVLPEDQPEETTTQVLQPEKPKETTTQVIEISI